MFPAQAVIWSSLIVKLYLVRAIEEYFMLNKSRTNLNNYPNFHKTEYVRKKALK